MPGESNDYYAFSIRYEPIADFEFNKPNRVRAFVKDAKIKLLEQQSVTKKKRHD